MHTHYTALLPSQFEKEEASATVINSLLRQFIARQKLSHARREFRSATAIQSTLRGSVMRRELRHQHSTAEYVQRHMRMLLVRRRLDKMNFAAYHIQGWYRQYRKTWAEKLVQRTKRRTVGVISKVANKVLAKPKAASSKAVSLFRRIAKKPKAESTTSAQPTSETKTRNIFRRAGGFFARAFGLKKKQKSKTAVQPPSAEEAFQRRIQQIESTSETKTTEAEAPARGASKFRAASRKVLPKRKSAFQRAGSFFSRLLRRKAKPQPVHDENKVLKSSSNQPGQPMCAALFACRVTQIAC